MQTWEYLQVESIMVYEKKESEWVWEANGNRLGKATGFWRLDNRPIADYMNQLGEQGWDLVSVGASGTTASVVFIFKRAKL